MQIYSFSVGAFAIGAYSKSDYLGLIKSLTWNLKFNLRKYKQILFKDYQEIFACS